VLKRYDNGLERCIGCSLCARPAHDCIYVEAAENTDAERHSPGERYAKVYESTCCAVFSAVIARKPVPTEAIVLEHDSPGE